MNASPMLCTRQPARLAMNAWPNSWQSLANPSATPKARMPPRLNRCGKVAMKRDQSRATRNTPNASSSGRATRTIQPP